MPKNATYTLLKPRHRWHPRDARVHRDKHQRDVVLRGAPLETPSSAGRIGAPPAGPLHADAPWGAYAALLGLAILAILALPRRARYLTFAVAYYCVSSPAAIVLNQRLLRDLHFG